MKYFYFFLSQTHHILSAEQSHVAMVSDDESLEEDLLWEINGQKQREYS